MISKCTTGLVADRLRELQGHGVVVRRKLPPPAASWVYELTDWGRELEPIVLALGGWGLHMPAPSPFTLSATSILLFLRGCARPDPAAPEATYRLELDDRVWTVRMAAGEAHILPGEPDRPDATLRTTPETLNALVDDPAALDTALAGGNATATGDLAAVRRLLRAANAGSQRDLAITPRP